MPLLHNYDLAKHIDGSCTPPSMSLPDDQPNPAYKLWFQRDQLVLSWIIGSMTESYIPQVVGATSARQAWVRLESTYASGSKTQIRTIKSNLYRL